MELLAGLVLFALSAFFSSSETALYRADWVRLTSLAERHVAGARAALDHLGRQDATIVTILIGNNLVNTFASVIFTSWFSRTFGPAWTSAAVVLVVAVTMVVGEYVPKSFAAAWPNRILRNAAGPLSILRIVFYPAVTMLIGISRVFGRSESGRRFVLTRQDFIAAVRRRSQSDPTESQQVANMVTRLFRFAGVKVGEVAIPIEEVKSVPHDAGLNAVLALTSQYGFSRIPVYDGSPTNITGVIVAKDLLAAPTFRVRKASRVSENARAMEVLRTMQRRGEHLAAVEDATGTVTGIVTLEDMLEELVGEIRSEG